MSRYLLRHRIRGCQSQTHKPNNTKSCFGERYSAARSRHCEPPHIHDSAVINQQSIHSLICMMQTSDDVRLLCSGDKHDGDYSGLMRREYQSKDMRTVDGQPYMHVTYYKSSTASELDSRLRMWADAASSGRHPGSIHSCYLL